MRPAPDERTTKREVGIVADFGRLDRRGNPIGEILADSDRKRLYFESPQAPSDIKQGDPVTFERGVFLSDKGNSDKAIAIRHLSADLHLASVREKCVTS